MPTPGWFSQYPGPAKFPLEQISIRQVDSVGRAELDKEAVGLEIQLRQNEQVLSKLRPRRLQMPDQL
jgi:hypothetical protein